MSHASSESTLPPGVKDVRKKVFWVSTLVILFFTAIILKSVWPKEKNDEKCTVEQHCALTYEKGASTEIVEVPENKISCFDAWFWDELDELGFTTFQQGSDLGTLYPCTMEDVMNGSCHAKTFKRFQFNPKEKIDLPSYWFISNRSSC